MCGEHFGVYVDLICLTGSSPHVRGAHNVLDVRVLTTGIIPACAGSTRFPYPQLEQTRDHPRMCGEHVASSRMS